MTITIPTGELTGLLADVIPFALDDDELPDLCCVRLEWDGEVLHAFAHDLGRVAWSQWSPDDPPDFDQDPLGVAWGGADGPWWLTLQLHDAQEVVDTFKLSRKQRSTPLTIDVIEGRLKVDRSRETSRSALTGVWPDAEVDFADLRAMLARWDRIKPVRSIAFPVDALADFRHVRPRGPVRFTFTGAESPALVEIGKRFVGAVTPSRTEPRSELRSGSGVTVIGPPA